VRYSPSYSILLTPTAGTNKLVPVTPSSSRVKVHLSSPHRSNVYQHSGGLCAGSRAKLLTRRDRSSNRQRSCHCPIPLREENDIAVLLFSLLSEEDVFSRFGLGRGELCAGGRPGGLLGCQFRLGLPQHGAAKRPWAVHDSRVEGERGLADGSHRFFSFLLWRGL